MIPTTHPISPLIILKSATTSSASELQELEKVFDHYNSQFLPNLLSKISPDVKATFFAGSEQIFGPDTEILSIEILDDSILFHIKSSQLEKKQLVEGTILFSGAKELLGNLDGSPMTQDYILESTENRIVYDFYFDAKILPSGEVEHSIDVYSFSEEPEDIEDNDMDDVEMLHLQFKFKGISVDLTPYASIEDENDEGPYEDMAPPLS